MTTETDPMIVAVEGGYLDLRDAAPQDFPAPHVTEETPA